MSDRPSVVLTPEDFQEVSTRLDKFDVFGFDTESHGPVLDTGKGRKKSFLNVYMSELTGYSLYFQDGAGFYIPLRHMVGSNAPVQHALSLLKDISKSPAIVYAHNWKHDAHVLSREDIRPPQAAFCTLVGAWLTRPDSPGRGLKALAKSMLSMEMASFADTTMGKSFDQLSPKEAVSYAVDDAKATFLLGERFRSSLTSLGMSEHFWSTEMPTAFMLLDMEQQGVNLDTDRMAKVHRSLNKDLLEVMQSWVCLFPVKINSAKDVAEYMYGTKQHWDVEGFKAGASGSFPANKEAISVHLARCPSGSLGHEAARLLSEFRQVTVLQNMFTSKLPRIAAQYPDGKLHPKLNQCGTETGRFSSAEPNAQQIPTHSPRGRLVKACIVPGEGNVFVSADYSQIELRLLAHYCKEGALYNAVHADHDLHQAVGDQLGQSRAVGKTINFATVYGASAWKISRTLGCSEAKAQDFLDDYDRRFPEVGRIKQRILRYARKHEITKTYAGRIRRLPGMRSAKGKEFASLARKATNTPFQGGAADIVKSAMLDIHRTLRGSEAAIVMQVHDEILIECPEKIAKEVSYILQKGMENAANLRVPLKAEPSIGQTWADCK